jgi:hypothetical protein
MESISLPNFYTGLALLPQFPVVKPANGRIYTEGEHLEVHLARGVEMGMAEVVAVKTIMLGKIPTTFCQYLTGKPKPYLLSILRRQYGVSDDSQMQVLVLKYTQRYLAAQQEVLKAWWNNQVEATPGYEAFKMEVNYAH